MHTLIVRHVDPNHASTRLDVFEADGRTRRGACHIVIREATLYLAAEMALQQQDGQSVFEYSVSSYVRDSRASVGLGYCRVASAAAPATSDARLLVNPDMIVVNGTAPGWQILGGSRPIEAKLATDSKDGALVLENLFCPEGLSQTVSLAPGHYLLRALAKTNVFQIDLVAESTRMPVAVGDEYQWVELPFCIPLSGDNSVKAVQVGFRYLARPATGNASRLPARLAVKHMELIRLGDTVLGAPWAETLPVAPVHRLKLINHAPEWSRPGKVVLQDAFLGTELWLMTQEGKVAHTYVDHPNFSREGKYLHIGFRRAPRGLLKTDGSARYLNDAWTGIVWMFPWEQKRLPAGSDPADWIVTARKTDGIQLLNVVTGQTQRIDLPSRSGWRIVHFPGIAIDHLLVTNDPSFVPRGRGQVPEELAAVPQGLRAVPLAPEDERALSASPKDQRPRVKLVWEEVSATQGVSHYNVYRSDKESFQAEAETLLGSPSGCVFYDVGLEAGQPVYYRVRAVDAWGNRSPPSATVAVTN